jgi:hypothetical protein
MTLPPFTASNERVAFGIAGIVMYGRADRAARMISATVNLHYLPIKAGLARQQRAFGRSLK